MPITYHRYCDGCTYDKREKYLSTEMPDSELPLSMEHNSNDVLLIFQAPGVYEWERKKPVCSDSDRSTAARIRNSLARIGKARNTFSITNAVQCFPGKLMSGRDKKPSKLGQCCCGNWLREDIESSNFEKIIVLGEIAKNSVQSLGYLNDGRFVFIGHPSGRLTNVVLDKALSQ